jgi:hypothetical protein
MNDEFLSDEGRYWGVSGKIKRKMSASIVAFSSDKCKRDRDGPNYNISYYTEAPCCFLELDWRVILEGIFPDYSLVGESSSDKRGSNFAARGAR